MSTHAHTITLAHGNGGVQMQQLLRTVIRPALATPALDDETDGAVLPPVPNAELVFTTDGFVVQPLFFPGGDIGHLAVCGTINDLAVMGAQPAALSLALIIEAGTPMATLERVMQSIGQTATAAGVPVVTGDTKVVESGQADQIYATTAGVGWRAPGTVPGWRACAPGDAVVVSGTIGHHGIAVLAARNALPFEREIRSDAMPVHRLVQAALEATPSIRWLRDPTRGGVAAALNELASQADLAIAVDQSRLPVTEEVRGAAEILGLEPVYLANEGRFLAICPAEDADTLVAALQSMPGGERAARIGTIEAAHPGGRVIVATGFGSTRILDMPSGEQLPRIC